MLASAVGAEIEIENANAQIAVEPVTSTNSLLTRLFALVSIAYVPKPI